MKVALGPLFGEATRAVFRHASRSALTALGIAIGVAAVVWVVAIGTAGAERAQEQLLALGDNLVWVEAGSRNVAGVRTGTHGTTSLTVEDAQAIAREVPLIKSVSPQVDGTVLLVHGDHNWTTRSRGVAPEYLDIKRWIVAAGTLFSDEQLSVAANVCLIGQTVRDKLFDTNEDPVGQVVRIGVQPFEVVGVLGAKGQSTTGQDQDDTIFVPYTTAQTKLRGRGLTWVDDIMCSAIAPEAVNEAAAEITELIRQRHHIAQGDDDDFNIRRPEEVIKAQMATNETFALLLISIASVALVVGGIGVMNVMLASVTERTREIGVRLAVGATDWAVQLQFLIEAVVLSLVGGVAGVVASAVGSFALRSILGWAVTIPIGAVVVALSFSVIVGVFFGFYPARRASKLDPVEALRQ